jgi:serine/threonine protein kinase
MSAINRNTPPKATLQICAATPVYQGKKIISKGAKTTRICFDDLPDEKYRIALSKCCLASQRLFPLLVNGEYTFVWLNTNSLSKRFGLPKGLFKQYLDLGPIIESVRNKLDFQAPKNDPSEDDGIEIPMLPIPSSHQLQLEEMAKLAKLENRDIYLSKALYNIPENVVISHDGFVSNGPRTKIGYGAHAVVHKSIDHDGHPIAQRSSYDIPKAKQLFQNLELFKGKRGILQTLSTAFYTDEKGRMVAVSFHPLYEHELFVVITKNNIVWSEQDAFDAAFDLLSGLVEMGKIGEHRDLSAQNVLTRRMKGRIEVVISDLEYFSTHAESKTSPSVSIWTSPELIKGGGSPIEIDPKRDVWSAGAMLFCIFQKPIRKSVHFFPWGSMKQEVLPKMAPPLQTQEKIDQQISTIGFRPAVLELIRGMVRVDPKERWTGENALTHLVNTCRPAIA